MTQKTLWVTGFVGLASIAIGLGIGRVTVTHEREGASPTHAIEQTPEYRELEARLRRTEAELESNKREKSLLALENARLVSEVEVLKASSARESQGAAKNARASEAIGRSGIEWTEFSTLLAENVAITKKRFGGEALTREEEAKDGLLVGELRKVSAKAKAKSSSPFFDSQIFDELTVALYKDSLKLTDVQVGLLRDLNSSIFQELPENLDELSPLEKFRLRRDILSQVWKGLEESLDEEQLEDWEFVHRYSEVVFRYGGRVQASVDLPVTRWLRAWLGRASGGAPSKEVIPIANEYVSSAKRVLQEFAQNNEERRVGVRGRGAPEAGRAVGREAPGHSSGSR